MEERHGSKGNRSGIPSDFGIRYGVIGEKTTPHIVGPSADSLHVPDELKPFMFPLLSINLAEATPPLTGRLMFIYAEYAESDANNQAQGLSFHIESDGTYSLDKTSASEFLRFTKEVDLPTAPQPKKWKGAFIDLKEIRTPEAHDGNIFEIRSALQKLEKSYFTDYPVFSKAPGWIQSPGYPKDPDGNPMQFIGQVNAAYFTDYAGPFELLLFYSAKHNLVTQFGQCS